MPLCRVSRKSHTDIHDIGLYTQQQWGKEQRRRYLSGMDERFRHLAETPFLGAERPEFQPPVRIHTYEKHLYQPARSPTDQVWVSLRSRAGLTKLR